MKKYFHHHLQHLKYQGHSKSTLKNHRITYDGVYEYCTRKGIDHPKSITLKNLNELMFEMVKVNKVSTVKMKMLQIKRLFGYWAKKGVVKYDVTVDLDMPRVEKTLTKDVPTKEEYQMLVDNIDCHYILNFMYRVIIELLYGTGMRIEELIHLKVSDIDVENRKIHLSQSKTLKERVIPLPESSTCYLKAYIDDVRPKILAFKNAVSDLIFVNMRGSKLIEGEINDKIRYFCKESGLSKSLTSHSFRYAYASHLFENNCDIRYISELLGHKHLSTTSQYIIISKKSLVDVLKEYHPREKREDEV